jgi:hypothetical protein
MPFRLLAPRAATMMMSISIAKRATLIAKIAASSQSTSHSSPSTFRFARPGPSGTSELGRDPQGRGFMPQMCELVPASGCLPARLRPPLGLVARTLIPSLMCVLVLPAPECEEDAIRHKDDEEACDHSYHDPVG